MAAAGALAIAVVAATGCAAYPPESLWRVLTLRDADADDMHVFPRREVRAAASAREMCRSRSTPTACAAP